MASLPTFWISPTAFRLWVNKMRAEIREMDLGRARRRPQSIMEYMVKASNDAWHESSREDRPISIDPQPQCCSLRRLQ